LAICVGIWAFGLLLYTIFVRISVPVLAGELTYDKRFRENDNTIDTRIDAEASGLSVADRTKE